jgi:hypothetical protein
VLAGSGRVSVKFCRIVADGQIRRTFTDSFTDTLPSLRRNLLEILHLKVEPMAGIEPATDGLRNRCSTTELHWLPLKRNLQDSFWKNQKIVASQFGSFQIIIRYRH